LREERGKKETLVGGIGQIVDISFLQLVSVYKRQGVFAISSFSIHKLIFQSVLKSEEAQPEGRREREVFERKREKPEVPGTWLWMDTFNSAYGKGRLVG